MLKNYLKIAWRNIRRNKSYSLINIIGLSVAIASCMLIFLFIQDELSYDRFHKKAENIYRVVISDNFGGSAQIPAVAKNKLTQFPEVKNAVRLYSEKKIVLDDASQAFEEKNFTYADDSFFDIFSFKLIQGNVATALSEPNTVVITKKTAQKYFGDANPIGKSLQFRDGQSYKITGVMEDLPHNSTVQFHMLASFSTLKAPKGIDDQGYLYILLKNREDVVPLEAKFKKLTTGTLDEVSQKLGFAFADLAFKLQPITDVHLYSALDGAIKAQSDVRYLYIFGVIGMFILLIASINYMNLATASSALRAREVGMRKVLGAKRLQLMGQFFLESVLCTAAAFLMALAIAQIMLPLFGTLTGKDLSFFDIQSGHFIGFSIIFVLTVGF